MQHPWNDLRRLSEEVNRAFNDALSQNGDGTNVVTSSWAPAVDIRETTESFVLAADIPGVEPKDIEVTMEKGVLTIRGERKLEAREDGGEQGFRRVERLHGAFHRRFSLPDSADAEGITARGAHGVLEIVIPKKKTVQPRRIEVG